MQNRHQKSKQITIWSIFLNSLLSLLKIISGYFGGSITIMADGIHSASDLLSDFAVLASIKISSQPPDQKHPYGHRKVESLTAFLLGLALAYIGVSFAFNGYQRLMAMLYDQFTYEISPFVIIGAILSIFFKEWIFHKTLRIGKELGNPSIIAYAWHHRSDAFSSVCALLGVSLAIWGGASWRIVDPIATILVAVFIFMTAFSIIRDNGSALLDSGANNETTQKIADCVDRIPGVLGVHNIRTRFHGSDLLVDLHVVVDPQWSVQQSHELCDEIELCLKSRLNIISDVVVHIEPSGTL